MTFRLDYEAEIALMFVITPTELKNHYGKYALLAEREEIAATKRGVIAFFLAPAQWKTWVDTKRVGLFSWPAFLPRKKSIVP